MSLVRYLPTPSDRMGVIWSLLCVGGAVVLEYGPAGTTHYSAGLFGALGAEVGDRLFTTHMTEDDVVMGDVSKLEAALVEIDREYAPEVIFVVASSISAVIGTDLRGVCAYMREKLRARLIPMDQGGFRGNFTLGLRESYRTLARELAKPDAPKLPGRYNLLGASVGSYRARSDVWEIEDLMRRAFGMEAHAKLCLDTDVNAIETMAGAEVNLALRAEALPCAEEMQKSGGTPFVTGAPYGYRGTLDWLNRVGAAMGRAADPALVRGMEAQAAEAARYRMYGMTRRAHMPAAAILGEYDLVAGLSTFLDELGLSVGHKICTHSLRDWPEAGPEIVSVTEERDRIALLKRLHHFLVLADDVSARLLAPDNTYLRVSNPLVNGAQIANHMPIMGPRGADFMLETIETYFQSLS